VLVEQDASAPAICADLSLVIEKRAIAQIFANMPGQVEGITVRAAALQGSLSTVDPLGSSRDRRKRRVRS
jgi:hypothetical protein